MPYHSNVEILKISAIILQISTVCTKEEVVKNLILWDVVLSIAATSSYSELQGDTLTIKWLKQWLENLPGKLQYTTPEATGHSPQGGAWNNLVL